MKTGRNLTLLSQVPCHEVVLKAWN